MSLVSRLQLLLAILSALKVEAQLQVDIRRYEHLPVSMDSSNFTILADYTFPTGFTSAWFTTAYTNIPVDGITGMLYQPDECSAHNVPSIGNCQTLRPGLMNISRIGLVSHGCCDISFEELSFDALLTYSPNDRIHEVRNAVCEPLREDINASVIPLAIISEEFAHTLKMTASNCSSDYVMLVTLSVGTIDVNSIRLALAVFISLSSLLLACLLLLSAFLLHLCRRKYCGRRGSYNVHDTHILQLGDLTELRGARFHGPQTQPYTPKQQEFHRSESTGNGVTQCAVCLEEFEEGEVISVLGCEGNHAFHPNCIQKWLDSRSTCPVCRTFMAPKYIT